MMGLPSLEEHPKKRSKEALVLILQCSPFLKRESLKHRILLRRMRRRGRRKK